MGLNTIAASIDEEPRHHRRSLRALPDPARISRPHAARPRGTDRAFDYFQSRAAACANRQPSLSSVKTVYLSLGSNIGDREAMLQSALDRLRVPGVIAALVGLRNRAAGSTEPALVSEHGLEAETALFPMQLLAASSALSGTWGAARVPKDLAPSTSTFCFTGVS